MPKFMTRLLTRACKRAAALLANTASAAMHMPFSAMSPGAWLSFGAPLVIALSLVLSVGPTVQKSVFSVVGGDAPTIYAAAYEDAIVRFPDLGTWLVGGLHGMFVLMAFAIVRVSLRHPEFRQFVVAIGLWSAIVLTVADLLFGLIDGALSAPDFFANLSANAVGGLVIGLAATLMLLVYKIALEVCEFLGAIGHAVAATTLIGIGALISTSAYLVLHFFYQPQAVQLQLTAAPPTSGYFAPSTPDKTPAPDRVADRSDLQSGFDFIPVGPVEATATLQGGGGKLQLTWHAPRGSPPFDVGASVLTNCIGKDVKALAMIKPSVRFAGVRSLAIKFDEGVSDLHVASVGGLSFDMSPREPTFFWLKPEDGNSLEVTQFVSPKDSIRIGALQSMEAVAGAMLFGKNGQAFDAAPRRLTIDVDGRRHQIHFPAPARPPRSHPLNCRELPGASDALTNTGLAKLDVPTGAIGVTVKFSFSPAAQAPIGGQTVSMQLTGVGGWLSVNGLKPSQRQHQELGQLAGLSLHGSIGDLRLDGQKVDLATGASIMAFGKLSASYLETGDLLVQGTAQSLWRGSQRASPTRWERTPVEWQIALIGAVIAALLGLLTFVPRALGRLAADDVRSWAK